MFRVYRVTGGDDANINVKKFAARYLTYLILQAIGTLTVTTTDPRVFVTALQDADELTVNFEGHPSGAWHKVIRWSFEKQGLFQPPGAPTPVTQPGAPPDVDVFINDGRNGEYEPYLTNLGTSPGVWNRLASDGGTANQEPTAGVTNTSTSASAIAAASRRRASPSSATRARRAAPWLAGRLDASDDSQPAWAGDRRGRQRYHRAIPVDAAQAGLVSVLAVWPQVTPATPTRSTAPSPTAAWCRTTTTWPSATLRRAGSLAAASASRSAPAPRLRQHQLATLRWQYGYLDVDTSAGKFTSTPRYFTTLGGNSSHWATTGATSIYNATPTGFRVYVRWSDGSA